MEEEDEEARYPLTQAIELSAYFFFKKGSIQLKHVWSAFPYTGVRFSLFPFAFCIPLCYALYVISSCVLLQRTVEKQNCGIFLVIPPTLFYFFIIIILSIKEEKGIRTKKLYFIKYSPSQLNYLLGTLRLILKDGKCGLIFFGLLKIGV